MIRTAPHRFRRAPWLWGAVACPLLAASSANATPQEPALLPRPAQLQLTAGEFALPASLPLRVARSDTELHELATALAARVERGCGRRLVVERGKPRDGTLALRRLSRGASPSPEAYRLEVTPRRIEIAAHQLAGLRHGSSTALQLLCARGHAVPALRIDDAPRFAWRGLMLDSARHFQSPSYLRRFIDAMALHKLNVLHWHLTDDQAWRLQILKYPKLTEVGAWRVPAGAAALADIDPATGAPRRYGGYYTQDEVRALVRYAADRGITIVPEIEMPGHASAAIAAYPELGAKRGAVRDVPADWGIYPNAFALDEATFGFLEDVLRETLALFPSRYIHVGGDEVEATQWLQSKAGRALADELGASDGHALQAQFTERMARFLAAQGRRLIGWDEILSPGLDQGATVMSWRGIEGAIAAAKQGHDTVLTPWPMLYFDNRQSRATDEPPGRVALIALKDVYAFDPMPATLSASAQRHVLGLQGAVWTEHIRTEARVDHMTFPRAAAIAELGWTPSARRDWPDFAQRLARLQSHYVALGIAAADSAYAVQAEVGHAPPHARAEIALSTQTGVGAIHYTLDGSEPTPASPRYDAPFWVPESSELRAASFLDGQALAKARRIPVAGTQARSSRELSLCSENIALVLEDDSPVRGERAVFALDIQNPCWMFKDADLHRAQTFEARVGQVPFNFQIGEAKDKIVFPKPTTAAGELEVRIDDCKGELLARLPLAPALSSTGVTALAPIKLDARPGHHNLCLRFAQPALEPVWTIDSIRLVPQ